MLSHTGFWSVGSLPAATMKRASRSWILRRMFFTSFSR
jgi:hypothetical protein